MSRRRPEPAPPCLPARRQVCLQAGWLRPGQLRTAVLLFAVLCAAFPNLLTAQAADPPQAANVVRATVHGIVKNAATGEPVARALVRIEGDAEAGALTDSEGHFEIPAVPVGPQILQVSKPGFSDHASSGIPSPPLIFNGAFNAEHNVRIAPDMPDMVFALVPTNSIRGQVTLSSGDPAQGISILLLRRSVQDGRAAWQPATNVRTNSEGVYRFAGLADGTYALCAESTLDAELPANIVHPGSAKAVVRAGYPAVFYPDARDLAGAAKVQVSGGEQAQANFLLTEEPFYLVRAGLTLPGGGTRGGSQMNVNVAILDAQGRQLPYTGQYDQATRSVQAFVPDGAYSLLVSTMGLARAVHFSGSGATSSMRSDDSAAQGPMAGQVDFSVAGRAVTDLEIPLVTERSNLVQLSVIGNRLQQAANTSQSPIVIMVSQAGGWSTDGMVSSFAEGYPTGPLETSIGMNPGAYWVHLSIPQRGLCEASFTAGGASLAREPLVLGLGGSSAPLTLTLRNDCATLNLSLPPSVTIPETGEEPSFTVYVVPDFDSTSDITPITLRPSSGGSFTLDGLTPGSYHVYTLRAAAELEYRNPEVLAGLTGQAVDLSPSTPTHLVLEAPQP